MFDVRLVDAGVISCPNKGEKVYFVIWKPTRWLTRVEI